MSQLPFNVAPGDSVGPYVLAVDVGSTARAAASTTARDARCAA